MSTSGTIATVLTVLIFAGGFYFAYSEGYLNDFLDTLSYNLGSIPQVNEIIGQSEPQVGTSSLTFVSSNTELSYPTLFPNPRWNHMPIKFYMDMESGSSINNFGSDDLDYVRQATKVWEEKTSGVISFVEVSNPEEAELVVSWFKELTEIKGGKVVGEGGPTRAIDTGGGFTLIEGGEVFLIPINEECRGVNRVVHEIGHVLGLGHSPLDRNDIMYSRETSCEQTITQVTIDAINELYKLTAAPDLVVVNVSAVKKGSALDINFTVRNIGLKDSLQTSIGFLANGEEIESLSAPSFSVIPRISPGSGLTNRITNVRVSSSTTLLSLIADSPAKISEMNENNNRAEVAFQSAGE